MRQPHLFDLAAVAPSAGERRAQRAAENREAKAARSAKWQAKQHRRAATKQAQARAFPGGSCPNPDCLHWFGPGHGWSACPSCKHPL